MDNIFTTEVDPSLALAIDSIKVTKNAPFSDCRISKDGTTVIVAKSTCSGSLNLGGGVRIPTHNLKEPSIYLFDVVAQKMIGSSCIELSDFKTFVSTGGGFVARYQRNQLLLIDAISGEQTNEFGAKASSNNTIAISSDGNCIGFLSSDDKYTVVRRSDGEIIIRISVNSDGLTGAKFSQSCDQIIIYNWTTRSNGGNVNRLRVINLISGKEEEFLLPTDWIHRLWVGNNAWRVATMCGNGLLQVWDLEDRARQSKEAQIEVSCDSEFHAGHKGHGMAVDDNADVIITYGHGFSGLKLWCMSHPLSCALLKSQNRIRALSNVSSDGKFAVCTNNGYLHVFSIDACTSATPDFDA